MNIFFEDLAVGFSGALLRLTMCRKYLQTQIHRHKSFLKA